MRLLTIALFSLIGCLGGGCYVHAQKDTVRANTAYRPAADLSEAARGLSLIVLKGDEIVFEEYHNGHTRDTAHLLASGTKSFSGVILAAAIEDGLIRGFDERVSETITEWRGVPRLEKITLRQLLSLTSGIDVGNNGWPPAYSAAVKQTPQFDPGDRFQYGPAPFQVFGEVMRRKLAPNRESVMEYLTRRILDPIGLSAARWTMQEGQPNLPSGAYLTAREWLKFGRFLKDGGRWNGKQIVKRSLLNELTKGSDANPNYGITFWLNRSHTGKARVADTTSRIRRLISDEDTGTTAISKFGIGNDIPADLYMAAGAANQRLYIIPSLDMVIVRQGRLARFDDRKFLGLILNGRNDDQQ